ncbi:MAG: DMT family transporter [Desulfarculus sp.]|nr:DMT family transporter [Desulfarculus sp.]
MTPPAAWRAKLWGVALVNLATLAWASNAVLGRFLRDDIGPLTLAALRFFLATALLLPLLRGLAPAERRLGADRWWLVGMALSGVVGFSPLLYWGLHHSSAVNSSLIQGFSPLITGLLAGWLISEPVTSRQMVGAALGLLGVVGLISRGSLDYLLALTFNPGDLLFLASAINWAVYSVCARRVMRTRSAVAATVVSNLLGLPLLVLGAAIELPHAPLNLTPATTLAIAHICLVPTILGYWSWNRAVQTLGAGGAMVFYNTLPLYGALLAALALGETLGPSTLVFGGLILAGGVWGTTGGGGR